MKNWSGSLTWKPTTIHTPNNKEEIRDIIISAKKPHKTIRMMGSSHSFVPLFKTDSIMVSLENYTGIVSIKDHLVTVKAGTTLKTLNRLLAQKELALENMGDIDTQTIAGAISTGTHGTGITFGNLSTLITELTFINGLGDSVTCSEKEHKDIFKAAQIALGTLGIITEITLKCVPLYKLQLVVNNDDLNDTLHNYKDICNTNRNFEFFWFPHTSRVMSKTTNLTSEKVDTPSIKNYLQDIVFENYALKLACHSSYLFPKKNNWLCKLSAQSIHYFKKTNYAHNIYAAQRVVKFNEMEYNIPFEALKDVKKEIMHCIRKNNFSIYFPLEVRFARKDDIYLSPNYKRNAAYIAVHMYNKKNYHTEFKAIETIFKAYNGRPHWGKIHTLTSKELATLYPKFDIFNRIRQEQDPYQQFLNPYLKSLFLSHA